MILLAAAIVAVAVAYLRRDSIARDIANAVLEGQDVTVSDLSVNFIQTDRIEFSNIVLRSADGAEIEISGLSFPLSFPSVTPEHVSIEELRIRPAADDGEPARYGEALRTVLNLPDELPSTAVTIARLSVPDTPTVTGIVWAVADRMQRLSFNVASVNGLVEIERSDGDEHRLMAQAGTAAGGDVLTLAFDVADDGDLIVLDGPVTARIAPLLAALETLEIVPVSIEFAEAALTGTTTIRVPNSGPIAAQTRISVGDQAELRYRANDGPGVDVRLVESDSIQVDVELPSFEWSASANRLELALNIGPVGNLPLRVGQLECRSTSACGADFEVEAADLRLPGLEVGRADIAASIRIPTAPPLVVDVAPELVLSLSEVKSAAMSVDSIEAGAFSGARFTVGDGTWAIAAEALELTLNGLTEGENLRVTSPVSLTDMRVEDSAASVQADVLIPVGAGTLGLRSYNLPMPGVSGKLTRGNDRILGAFDLSGGTDSLTGTIRAGYDESIGNFEIAIRGATLNFDERSLSARLASWPYTWDVVAGTWAIDATLLGTTDDYRGSMKHTVRALAGNYGDVAFAGLDGDVTIDVDSPASFTASSTAMELDLLDIGLPLENISAGFSLDGHGTLHVDALSMSALGGRITVDPFRYAGEQENLLLVRPRSVQLQFMAALAGFETIELSGSLSGMLPVSVKDGSITITDGMLENDPPGGVIRYRSDAAIAAEAPQTGLDIATTALANFEFDSLTSDVNYSADGDLTLQMRLTGVNPDYDANQPINLNLGVENNIPELLRSLQAIRSIEDVLERGTQN